MILNDPKYIKNESCLDIDSGWATMDDIYFSAHYTKISTLNRYCFTIRKKFFLIAYTNLKNVMPMPVDKK